VTLAGANDLLFGSSGSTDVSVSGSHDTIAAGTGPLTVMASSAAVLFGNTGLLTFVGGAGTSSIVGASGGSSAVTVGSGGVTFWSGTNSTTSIVGGAGQATLLGAANSSMFFSGAGGGLNFAAGAGNETLNASGSLTNNIYGGGLDSTGGTTIFGGVGNDTFIAGSGADSFVGGPSEDRFVFFAQATSLNASGAHDYIQDWTSQDGLFLIGYDSTLSASDVINNGTVSNGSLTITLSDHTQITFDNVTDKSEFNGKVLYS
jgi:Ca2+-binding RTX toxin-like protein